MKRIIFLLAALPILAQQAPVTWNGKLAVTVAEKQTVCSDELVVKVAGSYYFNILGSVAIDSGRVNGTSSFSPDVQPFCLGSVPIWFTSWAPVKEGQRVKICLYGENLPNGVASFDSGFVELIK